MRLVRKKTARREAADLAAGVDLAAADVAAASTVTVADEAIATKHQAIAKRMRQLKTDKQFEAVAFVFLCCRNPTSLQLTK
jgi:hypothetical protein